MSINQITKLCRVSEHTVRAVRDREAIPIAERKQRLTSIYGNVAQIAAERMEELAGTASLRDAGITAGIATDKLLALTQDSPVQSNNLHLHLQSNNPIKEWNDLIKRISDASPEERQILANSISNSSTDASASEERDRTKRG